MHEKSDVSTLETKLGGLALDAFAVEENGLATAGIDVSRGEAAQTFVAAVVVGVLDASFDLRFQVAS